MKEIEKHFETVASVVLGRPLKNLEEYDEWLLSNIPEARIIEKKSSVSGKMVYLPSVSFFLELGEKVISADEALVLGKKGIGAADVEALSIANASEKLAAIKTTTPEIVYGENIGTEKSVAYGPTQHCFRVCYCWFDKFLAYCYWIRTSDNCFGSSLLTDCSFCIKCQSSTKLMRCFEVADSNLCSDSYFCQNCEGLQDCMFCFNAKNLRYAVGNVVVGREAYLAFKKRMLESIATEIEAEKSLRYSIFNVCEGKKK